MSAQMRKAIALISIAFLTASVFARPAGTAAAPFPDATKTPFEQSVTDLARLGIIQGQGDGLYHPEDPVTRAAMAAIIARALKLKASDALTAGGQFRDVPATHWAAESIAAATSHGLMEGIGAGLFAPGDKLTLVQTLAILLRALGYEKPGGAKLPWPGGYVATALRVGLISETPPDDDWAPPVNRGSLALLLHRAVFVTPFADSDKTIAATVFGETADAGGTPPSPGKPAARVVLTAGTARGVANGVTPIELKVSIVDAMGDPVSQDFEVSLRVSEPQLALVSPGVVTTVSGQASALLMPTKVYGVATMTALVPGLSSGTATVIFDRPTLTSIAISADPPRLAADGASQTRVTARLLDQARVPVANDTGRVISVSVDGLEPAVVGPLPQTITIAPGDSSSFVDLRSTGLAGKAQIKATSSLSWVPITTGFLEAGPVGPLDHLAVQAVDESVVADGAQQAKIRAVLVDAAGHQLTGDNSTLLAAIVSDGTAEVLMPRVIARGGAAEFYLKSTTAGLVTIRVFAPSTVLPPSTAGIRFTAGQARNLVAAVQPGVPVAADGRSKAVITATVTDAYGNKVVDGSYLVSLARKDPAVHVFDLPAKTLAQTVGGEARFELIAGTAAGGETFQLTAGDLASTPTLTLTSVAAGAAHHLGVEGQASTIMVPAGSPLDLVVDVVDEAGNLVSSDEGRKVTLTAKPSGLTVGGDGVVHGGRAVFSLNSRAAQGYDLTIKTGSLGPAGSLQNRVSATVTFTAGPPDHIDLAATRSALLADAYSRLDLYAVLKDRYDNVLGFQDFVTLGLEAPNQPPASTAPVISATAITTDPSRSFAQLVSGSAPGDVLVKGKSALYPVSPLRVTMLRPGQPWAAVARATEGAVAGSGQKGSVTTIWVDVVDANGRVMSTLHTDPELSEAAVLLEGASDGAAISRGTDAGLTQYGLASDGKAKGSGAIIAGTATLAFSEPRAGVVTVTPAVYWKGQRLVSVPTKVTVKPGPPSTMDVTASPAVINADAGGESQITAMLLDSYGNPVPTAGDTVVFQPKTGSVMETTPAASILTEDGQASFTVRLKKGSVGQAQVAVRSLTYYTQGATVTVVSDRVPSKPRVEAWDQGRVDHDLTLLDNAVTLVISVDNHVLPLMAKAFVDGREVPLYTAADCRVRAPDLTAGNNTLVGYVKKSDLGPDGRKEFKVTVVNELGTSPPSEAAAVTVDSTR